MELIPSTDYLFNWVFPTVLREDPEASSRIERGYNFYFEDDGGGGWSLIRRDGKCVILRGLQDEVDCSLTLKEARYFVNMVYDPGAGPTLLWTNKLRIVGNQLSLGRLTTIMTRAVSSEILEKAAAVHRRFCEAVRFTVLETKLLPPVADGWSRNRQLEASHIDSVFAWTTHVRYGCENRSGKEITSFAGRVILRSGGNEWLRREDVAHFQPLKPGESKTAECTRHHERHGQQDDARRATERLEISWEPTNIRFADGTALPPVGQPS